MSEEILLVKRAARGDKEAFEQIVLQYEKQVYYYCLRMTNSQQEAEDLTQEIFIKIYRNLKSFKRQSKLSTWIYRIATNTCVDASRKNRISTCSDDSWIANMPEKEVLQPEQQVTKKEEMEAVKACIATLKEEFKTTVILRDIKYWTYQEIAEVMDLPLGTVKSNVNRARKALKKCLISKGINLLNKEGDKNDM